MGAFRSVFTPPTNSSGELDEGWSLDDEMEPTAPRKVPQVVNLDTCLNYETSADWSLAQEEATRVPAVSVHSALVNPLTDEELEEFALAELAMGTEVGLPVSEELWFEELRCIVPRRRTPSVSDNLPTAKPLADLPLLAMPDEFTPVASQPAPPTAKKARWWKRLRRS